MPTPLLARVFKKLAVGVLRTANEKWIDGLAAISVIVYLLASKPSSAWDALVPFIWLLAGIALVRVGVATSQVWSEIKHQPRERAVQSPVLDSSGNNLTLVADPPPPYFQAKLSGILLVSVLLLVAFAYAAQSLALAKLRTYIYLVPSAELMECQKRALFIRVEGPQFLSNVEIALRDNKSGQTVAKTYAEMGPGTRPSGEYLWVYPSSPWDEDYTSTVTTRESRSSQRIILRSIQNQAQLATQITLDDAKTPTMSCRDSFLPASYTVATGEHRTCTPLMKAAGDVPSDLDVDSYQRADGSLTIRRLKTLPSPSELDEQSDDRHITDYGRQLIEPVLAKYGGSHVLIYFAGGPKTRAYAEEFRKMFSGKRWVVQGPRMVPVGDERIIDVQMSVNNHDNWNRYDPKPHDVLNAFEKAGIKQRSNLTLDPNAPSGWIVLWVGPRSPRDVKPEQCSPVEINPVEGQHHGCEMISQISGALCPIPPK